jgi:hypothetical protein
MVAGCASNDGHNPSRGELRKTDPIAPPVYLDLEIVARFDVREDHAGGACKVAEALDEARTSSLL